MSHRIIPLCSREREEDFYNTQYIESQIEELKKNTKAANKNGNTEYVFEELQYIILMDVEKGNSISGREDTGIEKKTA